MKKLIIALTAIIIALAVIVITRTLTLRSKQINITNKSTVRVNIKAASEHLSKAIQFKTITYDDKSIPVKWDEFEKLEKYLEGAYPLVHAKLAKEKIGGHTLLYRWDGSDKDLKPVLFMAHQDVVPPNANSNDAWTHGPFSGAIAGGEIWGRGALDDKSSMIAQFEAVEMLLREGYRPARTIYLEFGHDEEPGGEEGARKAAELFKSRGIRFEYILDEGSVITEKLVPGIKAPVALISVAEKGVINLELSVKGEGGHSSFPPRHTPLGILCRAVERLEKDQFPARLDGATEQMFDYLAPEMPSGLKIIFANRWLFGPLIKAKLLASPTSAATIRTTISPTMMEGSNKWNALPVLAKALISFKILPGESIQSVTERARKTIDDPRIAMGSRGFSAEPSRVATAGSSNFKIIQKTIAQVYPGVIAAPALQMALTDSRHFNHLSDEVYEFMPLRISKERMKLFHGVDERIPIKDFEDGIRFYYELIRNSNRRGSGI